MWCRPNGGFGLEKWMNVNVGLRRVVNLGDPGGFPDRRVKGRTRITRNLPLTFLARGGVDRPR